MLDLVNREKISWLLEKIWKFVLTILTSKYWTDKYEILDKPESRSIRLFKEKIWECREILEWKDNETWGSFEERKEF